MPLSITLNSKNHPFLVVTAKIHIKASKTMPNLADYHNKAILRLETFGEPHPINTACKSIHLRPSKKLHAFMDYFSCLMHEVNIEYVIHFTWLIALLNAVSAFIQFIFHVFMHIKCLYIMYTSQQNMNVQCFVCTC